jgi:DNA-binding response OmpR family regulator
VARIRAALRKRETPEPSGPYVLVNLTIDYAARRATFAGSPVLLTSIEYRTLVELSANAGRVLTYEICCSGCGTELDTAVRPIRTVISTESYRRSTPRSGERSA